MVNNNIVNSVIFLLGGIAVLIFGINLMSDSLRAVAGKRFRVLIEKSTNSLIKGVIVGMLVTAIIHSSAGVTALTIGLVRAGLMTFPQSVGIILGANIGTTFTGILASIDIGKYSVIFIFVGFVGTLFKNKKIKSAGLAITGFGLLFLGLQFMSTSVKNLFSNDILKNIMASMGGNNWYSPALGFGFGTVVTFIMQSSTAFMLVLQEIYAAGIIPIKGAIPMMLGANVGTTFTALIASAGSDKEAKKTGMVHVLFNVITVIPFLILLTPFSLLMEWIEKIIFKPNSDGSLKHPAFTVALSNAIQNILATLMMLGFVKQLIWLASKIVGAKTTNSKEELKFDDSLIKEPELALAFVKKVLGSCMNNVYEYFSLTKSLLYTNVKNASDESAQLELIIDNFEKRTHDYLIKISASGVSSEDALQISVFSDHNKDLERIGDHFNNLVDFFLEIYSQRQSISDIELQELEDMFTKIGVMLENVIKSFSSSQKELVMSNFSIEPEIDKLEKQYKLAHIERMKHAKVITKLDENYSEILANLERIADHLTNISQAINEPREIYQIEG
jgi:phosphate:Na+ symporter